MKKPKRLPYYGNCVQQSGEWVTSVVEDAVQITRGTFLNHVDRSDMKTLEQLLGYESHHTKGLVMSSDYHVTYHKSQYRGNPLYFFTHSCIEYFFK